MKEILIPRTLKHFSEDIRAMVDDKTNYKVNPTGKFVIGGPHGDTGLTGRKIIVDTYGGRGAHGGGAFSGKDPSKVDRSAAYACRHIAKNVVAAGIADEVLVQVAYAIGVAEPVSFNINTYGTSHVDTIVVSTQHDEDVDRERIERDVKEILIPRTLEVEVELFTWEKLNMTETLRNAFGLN